MSLLPTQIIPQQVPLASMDKAGRIIIEKNWWLLLYNISQQVLANGLPASGIIALDSIGSNAADADVSELQCGLDNLKVQALQSPQVSAADIPEIATALLLAQIGLLPDVAPQAQPVAAISPGASPFTYKAPSNGQVAVTGGAVSAIALIRQGATVATGLTVGLFVLAQFDQLVVTYSGAPTMTFLPA